MNSQTFFGSTKPDNDNQDNQTQDHRFQLVKSTQVFSTQSCKKGWCPQHRTNRDRVRQAHRRGTDGKGASLHMWGAHHDFKEV